MKRIIRILAAFEAFLLVGLAAIAQAQAQNCTAGTLCNYLNPAFSTIPGFISGALKVLVIVALPIITLFFVYSGFLFIKAQGNDGELTTAKKNFVYVVLGSLLILGAWVIATLIGGTVSQLVTN